MKHSYIPDLPDMNERKLAPSSILIAVSAIRFPYKVTLKRGWVLAGGHSNL